MAHFDELNRSVDSEGSTGSSLRLKFSKMKHYPSNVHQDMLAISKQDYHGKDFFQRKEFRGLLLADYQEAIGEKAFQCVDQLNTNTVSQFSTLRSFKESLSKRKILEKFYKQGGIKTFMATRKSSIDSQSQSGGHTIQVQAKNGNRNLMGMTLLTDASQMELNKINNQVNYGTLVKNSMRSTSHVHGKNLNSHFNISTVNSFCNPTQNMRDNHRNKLFSTQQYKCLERGQSTQP